MTQVNGFQPPGLGFSRPAGGLKGFQRQGMDQRKKGRAALSPPPLYALTQWTTSGDIGVSGSGLTLTNTSGSGTSAALAANVGRSIGKLYAECNLSSAQQGGLGLATAAGLVSINGGVTGGDVYTGPGNIGTRGGSAAVNVASAPVTGALDGSGTVIAMAADLDNGLVWFRNVTGGHWNGDAAADPALGLGGVSLSVLSGLAADGKYYLVLSVVNTFNSVAAVTPSFAGVVPTGFYGWQGL